MGPRLLAFDTSTEQMAVALTDGSHRWTRNEAGGAQASARLLPAAEALLRDAGLRWADLHAIAFGRGPGAFTGLRTACAVAQGLAFALDRPVLPLCSLMLVAEDARDTHDAQAAGAPGHDRVVAMDARMDEVYAARFRFDGARWQQTSAPALYTLAALQDRWGGQLLPGLAGNAAGIFGARLGLRALTTTAEHDRAAALLRLALQQWHAGASVPADAALPLYLRDKVALTTAERQAARAAGGPPPAPSQP